MSSALCSVAIEIVEPARNTGSSTAYGVTAPVRPTLTSIRSSVVSPAAAGNLKAVAQRGNFAVAPSRSPQREVVDLDDDAVGVERRASRRLSAHSCAERDDRVDAVAAPPVRLDRQPPRGERRQRVGMASSAARRRRSRLGRDAPARPADRRTHAGPRLRDERRIEIPHRAGRGVARVREQRLAGVLALAVHALERGARQVDLAADLDRGRRARRAATAESRGWSGRWR